jgi:hypothetical protein
MVSFVSSRALEEVVAMMMNALTVEQQKRVLQRTYQQVASQVSSMKPSNRLRCFTPLGDDCEHLKARQVNAKHS